MSPASQPLQPLSEILGELADNPAERVSLDDLMRRFGGRALGAMLLIFGLLCMLPLPPGATTIFGAPLLLFAPQLVFGSAHTPWLPRRLRDRTVPMGDLREGLSRAARLLHRMEAVSRPRLPFLVGPGGERLVGVVCTVLALVLILPIPLGNILPATAVAVLSLSLVQKDGVLALLGYAVTAVSAGVLVIAARIVIGFVQHFLTGLSPG
jgi:hypothetical protein